MSNTADKLIKMSVNYEQLAAESLLVTAKKKEKHKRDPKAKVRNRGTVCVPASSAKDHEDHFPINDEDQARNALARVHQYSSAPSWYKGSLKGLQDLVSRKVHHKYPSIGKEKKKKSSFESMNEFLTAYGVEDTEELLSTYGELFERPEVLEAYADKKKEKHKRDPKAKVRNRGTVVFPAESSKDHEDHFPINDEDQARNAWARAHQYSKAPSWYSGSLKSLQEAVRRKVHSKYPGIEFEDKKKKKSSLEDFEEQFTKYASEVD